MANKGQTKERLALVPVPERVVVSALFGIAAVFEESYCSLGPVEAKALVRVHQQLCRALGRHAPDDYAWDGRQVVYRVDRSKVCKVPVDARPVLPIGDAVVSTARQSAMRVLLRRVDAGLAEAERDET